MLLSQRNRGSSKSPKSNCFQSLRRKKKKNTVKEGSKLRKMEVEALVVVGPGRGKKRLRLQQGKKKEHATAGEREKSVLLGFLCSVSTKNNKEVDENKEKKNSRLKWEKISQNNNILLTYLWRTKFIIKENYKIPNMLTLHHINQI